MNNPAFCYIHIPFCTSRCNYCRFTTFSNFDALKVSFYVDFLCKSIKLKTGFERIPLKSVYFGGGTPSVLSISQIEQIIFALREVYSFEPDTEMTLETTPQNISLKNLQAWSDLGINRISTGIQSLNPEALKEVGRITPEQIIEKLDILETSPIQNIALDFIIGLPYTRPGELSGDISRILEKYPFIKHISVYMLEDYTYPKNWEKHAFPKELFNDEYLEIKSRLQDFGFHRYELSNYSRVGFECVHNKSYWNHSEMIAFGLGAYGYEKGIRYNHAENFKDYYAGNQYFQEILDLKDIRIENIMFGLRTSGFHETLIGQQQKEKLTEYIKSGYLEKKEDMIIMGEKGYAVMDTILSDII